MAIQRRRAHRRSAIPQPKPTAPRQHQLLRSDNRVLQPGRSDRRDRVSRQMRSRVPTTGRLAVLREKGHMRQLADLADFVFDCLAEQPRATSKLSRRAWSIRPSLSAECIVEFSAPPIPRRTARSRPERRTSRRVLHARLTRSPPAYPVLALHHEIVSLSSTSPRARDQTHDLDIFQLPTSFSSYLSIHHTTKYILLRMLSYVW